MNKQDLILERIKGGLIVSCQALEDEPLHGSYIMGRMALAAKIGGAVGIRANTPKDCLVIKENVDLPQISIYKKVYTGSEVYITPTIEEVKKLMAVKPEIIAADATNRKRPDGKSLEEFVKEIRKIYDGILMADISTYEEGVQASKLGFNIISTTLNGYTEYTKDDPKPNFQLMERLAKGLDIPIIAEGNIETPEDAKECFRRGVFSIVVGAAITRPQLITERFVKAISSLDL